MLMKRATAKRHQFKIISAQFALKMRVASEIVKNSLKLAF